MAETVITVAIEVAKCLADPISRRLRYLFCFNQFIGDIGNAKDELLPKLEEVKMCRDEATRKTEEVMPTVKKWLDDVEAILQEVQKFQQEAEEGGKKCFNISLRYSLAKQMENKAKQMRDLKNNSHFEQFSQPIQLPGISYFSSRGFVDFNSRKSTYNSILEAIKDGKNKMVGLYGMGGSGKTTLAKEVGRKVSELKLFDKVIMVVIAKPPNVIKIQQEIAEQIDLEFEEEIPSNRAQRLSIALKNQKIFIILDDVWNIINLQDIGIPHGQGCHILLTTRLRDVCVSMHCDSIIELTLLTKEEAWALFIIHVNIATISRISTYNSLLEAIKDGKNKMVGLYGMGGSGKTTLAKEVGKKVDELKLFNKVIMVVVSKLPNVINIQQEIAEQIGLEFEEEIPSNRAQRLSTALKNQKILIILDDVWAKINLEDIGILLNQGCRILLTTRLQDVCNSMNCDSKIEFRLLTMDEAWALFKIGANLTKHSTHEFDVIGWKIIDECKGLPIAIVAMGSTLKGKSVVAWELALQRLQHSLPLDIDEGLMTPYACLRFSYDNLPNPVAKSLFLMCSMFPEDHEIHIEDLIRFGKGTLELDHEIADTMQNSRRVILSTINNLIDSCLLMPTDKQECVKMHDVVRDVALRIAKERHQAILVDSHAVSKMLNKNKIVNDTKVISLWNLNENFKLSIQLSCPTLEILLLHPREFIKDLGGLEALKVLALVTFSCEWDVQETITQWSMPQSIVSLTNLSTLCLRGIALGDISFLGKLKGLEILDLRGSSFNELPIDIVDIKMLKLLDVFGCSIKQRPYEVIGRCQQLQELYLWNSKSTIPENFSILELKRYVICDSTQCVTSFVLPSLEYFAGCDEALKAFCIQGFNVSMLRSTKRYLLLGANFLWLDNCRWDNKDLNSEIKCLVVSCCPEKRVIVDNLDINILQTKQVFSHLVTLKLSEMNGLEHVFQDSSINCSLKKLQELYMEHCPQLHDICFPNSSNLSCLKTLVLYDCPMLKSSIFTPSIAQSLVLLEQLSINHCNNLKHIIAECEEEENDDGTSDAGDFSKAFRNLRTLDVGSCAELESIIPLFFAQCLLTLESLSVQSTPKLQYVVGGRKDDRVASVHQMNEDKN